MTCRMVEERGMGVNIRDKLYLEQLHRDRSESADTFEKPSTRDMWRSIVEKYSDQAHFIYELIQNADDAGATSARFVLEENRLIFAHNGSRYFSISNPETEDIDSRCGMLGDINAITGIAFSNKKTQDNKIGKFGVGFKAVFQYTKTPHIYDPVFRFRINRYIVPTKLDEDFPGRGTDETLFVFPFDHEDRDPKETYRDIEGKLRNLSHPVLFLSHLSRISFTIGELVGGYEKRLEEEYAFDDLTSERLELIQKIGGEVSVKRLLLFSRSRNGLSYSVGFFLDESGALIPVNEPAFCYFPTKETTGLHFLIHAPFLLTDSREGIRAGIPHNVELIDLLSTLAADAVVCLRDIGLKKGARLLNDDIISIIPTDPDVFCEPDDVHRVSFRAFYTAIRNTFATQSVLPTRTGYTSSEHAYWAMNPTLANLFSEKQLGKMTGDEQSAWIFPSLSREETQRGRHKIFDYINGVSVMGVNEKYFLTHVDAHFIERQEAGWLHSFYRWLSETQNRVAYAETAPIFLDQFSRAAAIADESGHHLLFLPEPDAIGFRTIRPDFLEEASTVEFLNLLGLSQPLLEDRIFSVILPKYRNKTSILSERHFELLFDYFGKCPQEEVSAFVEEIRKYEFFSYFSDGERSLCGERVTELYFPEEQWQRFFSEKPSTKFLDWESYKGMISPDAEGRLRDFFRKLGVRFFPARSEKVTGDGRLHQVVEYEIDGLRESVEAAVSTEDPERSVFLWRMLCELEENNILDRNILKKQVMSRKTRRQNWTTVYEDSETSVLLRTAPWILNKKGSFVRATEVTKSTLSDIYPTDCRGASELAEILEIGDRVSAEEEAKLLSDEQRTHIEFAKWCSEQGITREDLEEVLENKRRKQRKKSEPEEMPWIEIIDEVGKEDGVGGSGETKSKKSGSRSGRTFHQATARVTKEIFQRTNPVPTVHSGEKIVEPEESDGDELIPTSVDFGRKAELEKQKAAAAIDRIAYQEELQARALAAKRYSFEWFRILLRLESLSSNMNDMNSREIAIGFSRVEREEGTQRTLILKHPNRYVPQFLEDLGDIPLTLKTGDQSRRLMIEVANVKSYTLRVKLKSSADMEGLDLESIQEANIDVGSPSFLLEALRREFGKFPYEPDYDMQSHLPSNIEFVFGPPGTGKTTCLANEVLIPLMAKEKDLNVLVLAPTNKAADVLVRRVMTSMGEDTSYRNWLVRFGVTGDEVIEESSIYRDRTWDIGSVKRSVTVTTIARFAYDHLTSGGKALPLNIFDWDDIVFDEASMIPLATILYPLYKMKPEKFIVAGDPFQIEPIIAVNLWKNENIYTMVGLDSFVHPKTVPHPYPVKLLMRQFRSTPTVGEVFSRFAYGGKLQHHRTQESRRSLNIESHLDVRSLNLIKFPMSRYESIYRSKRLHQSSSYQIYSAIFTFEFLSELSRWIAEANPGETFKIGVVAPYRAQADLIEKLVATKNHPKETEIQVGTIHGFQGDECDIVLAVFNPPPTIGTGKEMFLNKRNILNVSVSRAKDYLFIIMPDDRTENIHRLQLVKQLEGLLKRSGDCAEYSSEDIEEILFGERNYLENNAFSTGHQNVNVYGKPEKRYEIRTEDNAVDVQLVDADRSERLGG